MASTDLPTRLIICVDGTYCTPDGPNGKGYGNISNIYRICAAIKTGECQDEVTQQEFSQEKEYVEGIGSTDEIGSLGRLRAGLLGHGYKKKIKEVYERCCKMDAKDEIWLYGFSRGAYIVRAVAGLLHHIGSLKSAGGSQFEKEYSDALKVYSDLKNRSNLGLGQKHRFLSHSTKPPAKIQFIGAFDTVKALDDENLYDISFNDSTQHFRHALALNENRVAMTPEYVFPDYDPTKNRLLKRSIVQAWFIGAHIDMGGSAKRDGLSLYPLQWILIESQSNGLVLEYSSMFDDRAPIDNPLLVVFPQTETDGRGHDMWTCTTENKMKVSMQDVRHVHVLEVYESRYNIKLNKRNALIWPKKAREPFDADGKLRGYCIFGPQGTILHPSVYQLLDDSLAIALNKAAMPDRDNIEAWRSRMLGEPHDLLHTGFWTDRRGLEIDDLRSIRILVCGNTGVGKSTLVDRVFGVPESDEVTKSSQRKGGLHDVRKEIILENRPDLILHDSAGFETGDESQLHAVEEFLKAKRLELRLADQLHVISRFCIEMDSVRIRQTATESLFTAVSKYAADVPIIIVATKMDKFREIQRQLAEKEYAESIKDKAELYEKGKAYAAEQLLKRMKQIEEEMREVGRFDASVDVASNDKESINRLSAITLENVNHENVRIRYIAAQVANIDMKIDCAIVETMKVYRKVIGTASGLAALPGASTTNRTAGAISVCKEIVKCFGLPTVSHETIFEIVKATVWDDVSHNVSTTLAEGIATIGLLSTVFMGGIPIFLAAGAVNIPLVVPATTRLMLMLASDLILILTMAFKEITLACIGQPQYEDVNRAARRYRDFSSTVHNAILKLVPKTNLTKSYRYNAVQSGLEEVVRRYKQQVCADTPTDARINKPSFDSEATACDEEVAEIKTVFKNAEAELRLKLG